MAMFTLMRKNEEVMMLQIGQDGNITKLGKRENIALLPLQNRTSPKGVIPELYKRKTDMYERFAAGVNLSTLRF